MKSISIVFGLCAAFLVSSAQMPDAFKARFAASIDQRQCSLTEKTNGPTPSLKRTKTARLPRWHRLIPGMFR
jgi:hypothetical protein